MFEVKDFPALSHERFRLGIAVMDALTKHIDVVISNLIWLIKSDEFKEAAEKSHFRLTFPFQAGAGYWEVSLHKQGIDAITFCLTDVPRMVKTWSTKEDIPESEKFLRIAQWDGRNFFFFSSKEKYRWISTVYEHLQDLVQGIVVTFPQIAPRMKHFDDMADSHERLLSKQ